MFLGVLGALAFGLFFAYLFDYRYFRGQKRKSSVTYLDDYRRQKGA